MFTHVSYIHLFAKKKQQKDLVTWKIMEISIPEVRSLGFLMGDFMLPIEQRRFLIHYTT